MPDTLIDLIRHGEPVGGRRYRGRRINDPLSSQGWMQMHRAIGDEAPWRQILSSPMARCRDFAQIIATRRQLPLAIEPDLIEIGMGEWEGCTHADIAARAPECYQAYRRDPVNCRPRDAEPLDAFMARITNAYQRQCACYPGQHLLIVCHAGVMRALITHTLGLSIHDLSRFKIDYAGIVRIRHTVFGPVIECINRERLP